MPGILPGDDVYLGRSDPNSQFYSGGGMDPFAYSGGSLLTPFTAAQPMSGGVSASYAPQFYTPGTITPETYSAPQTYNPAQFSYGQLVPGLTLPTSLNESNDPGYEFRRKAGEQSLQNQFSAQGARGGDVMKAFDRYNQDYASGEWGNLYARALATNQQQAALQNQGFQQGYAGSALNSQNNLASAQLNEQNRLNAFNTNMGSLMGAFQANEAGKLGAAQVNSQASLAGGQLGLAASAQDYSQRSNDFNTAWNVYNTNQNNQFSRLFNLMSLGQNSANNLGNQASAYGNNLSNLITGGGNAAAAGAVGQGNAWSNFYSGLGNLGVLPLYGSPLAQPGGPMQPGGTR